MYFLKYDNTPKMLTVAILKGKYYVKDQKLFLFPSL